MIKCAQRKPPILFWLVTRGWGKLWLNVRSKHYGPAGLFVKGSYYTRPRIPSPLVLLVILPMLSNHLEVSLTETAEHGLLSSLGTNQRDMLPMAVILIALSFKVAYRPSTAGGTIEQEAASVPNGNRWSCFGC
jgi:hypothetical protein